MKETFLDYIEPLFPALTFKIRRRSARMYELAEPNYESRAILAEGDVLVINKKMRRRELFPHVGWKEDFVVLVDGTVVLRRNHSLRHLDLAQGQKLLFAGVAFGPMDDRENPDRPGCMDTIMNHSGHYMTDPESLKIARNAFRKLRIPISKHFTMLPHS